MQRLDTAITNITAVSMNFLLIKLVKEQSLIFCNSKFTFVCYFERTLNIHPPFVVSVAVLLIRGGFINIKSLHVKYYRPFDRSMGL